MFIDTWSDTPEFTQGYDEDCKNLYFLLGKSSVHLCVNITTKFHFLFRLKVALYKMQKKACFMR